MQQLPQRQVEVREHILPTWGTLPGGVSDPGNNASFSSGVAGTYGATVTDNNGCVSSSTTGEVTIYTASVSAGSDIAVDAGFLQ